MDLEAIFKDRLNGSHPQQAMRDHMVYLRETVISRNAQAVIELGVHTGQSTIAFLCGLQKTGGHLWSCDTDWPKPPIDEVFAAHSDRVTFVLGDSQTVSQYALSPADILLVDASLRNRLDDLRLYGPMVRPGGLILVHDMDRSEVAEAVGMYLLRRQHYGFSLIERGHGLAVIEV